MPFKPLGASQVARGLPCTAQLFVNEDQRAFCLGNVASASVALANMAARMMDGHRSVTQGFRDDCFVCFVHNVKPPVFIQTHSRFLIEFVCLAASAFLKFAYSMRLVNVG